MKTSAQTFLDNLIDRYAVLSVCKPDIIKAFGLLKGCFDARGKVLVCGNGGSAADAGHIVGELMKGFTLNRPLGAEDANRLKAAFPEDWEYLVSRLQGALPAISLATHSSVMTAVCNDTASDMAFAQQVYGYGRKGDVLVGLSTSGNSKNVVNAVKVARAFGIAALGLTGAGGGLMAQICDVVIRIPETETYKVQELTLPVYHALCLMLEVEFFEI